MQIGQYLTNLFGYLQDFALWQGLAGGIDPIHQCLAFNKFHHHIVPALFAKVIGYFRKVGVFQAGQHFSFLFKVSQG